MYNPMWEVIEIWFGKYMIFINRLCLWHTTNHQAFEDAHIDSSGRYHLKLLDTDVKNDLAYLNKIKASKWVYLDYYLGIVRAVIMICGSVVLLFILIRNGWYVKGSLLDMVFSHIQIFR